MGEIVLSACGLSKKYGLSYALDDVSIEIERGQIFGLVGKNGAGKTTLMRVVCGQSTLFSGSVGLFGHSGKRGLAEARTRVGFMIEAPAFYPKLSARENLKIYCMKRGLPVSENLDGLLASVGLPGVGGKRYSEFSLGMKERLGLALAILGDPELLVLDEPTNGLDPIGISQVRELILRLNRERGVTVLISSHILKELSSVATHFGFIHNGRLIEQLSSKELHARCSDALSLTVDDVEKACAVLENICGCRNYKIFPHNTIRCYDGAVRPELLNRELNENGVGVSSLMREGKDLEAYFIGLLKEGRANAQLY
ncbi:MAG: ABC transporter ATP-binding protein [Oscillospiraceae bacterium]|jgi:ABC-2 type transport system ATP-binding protein|nr:ABC transporter ATP-binding protein [Oscillospiraceae bacterium]